MIYCIGLHILDNIYEHQSETEKAIENYENFLELRKDGNPGFPEVDDAKKRLAGLKGE